MTTRAVLLIAGIVGLTSITILGGPAVVAGASEFTISLSPEVDTPLREVTFEGSTYDVAGVGRIDTDESISASVTAPSDATYDILVYNVDKQILYSKERTGVASARFDMSGFDSGTYLVVIDHDGTFETLEPFVIASYHVSVTAPSEALTNETIDIEATLTKAANGTNLSQVQVVIGNSSLDDRTTMSMISENRYEASVNLSSLPIGNYSLYVVVQGEQQAFGTKELIGISDAQSLTINPTPTPTPTSTPSPTLTPTATATPTDSNSGNSGGGSGGSSGGGGGGGGGAGGSSPTDTPTTTATQTPTMTPETRTPATTTPETETGTATEAAIRTKTTTTRTKTTTAPPTNESLKENRTPTTASPDTATTAGETPESETPEGVILPSTSTGQKRTAPNQETATPGQALGNYLILIAFTIFILMWRRK